MISDTIGELPCVTPPFHPAHRRTFFESDLRRTPEMPPHHGPGAPWQQRFHRAKRVNRKGRAAFPLFHMHEGKAKEVYSSLISNDHGVIHVRNHHHLANISQTFLDACADGTLIKLSRGGYTWRVDYEQSSAWDRHRFRIAATAADYSSAVVVGNSAGIWHQLWIHDPCPQVVEIHRFSARIRTLTTLRLADSLRNLHTPVGDHEKTIVDGVAVTTVERTILDICRIHGLAPAFISLCHALRRKITTKEKMREAFHACTWNDHIPRFSQLIDHATGLHRFPTSAYLHALIVAEGCLTVTGIGEDVLQVKELRHPIALRGSECRAYQVFLESRSSRLELLDATHLDPEHGLMEWDEKEKSSPAEQDCRGDGQCLDSINTSPLDRMLAQKSKLAISMELGISRSRVESGDFGLHAPRCPFECCADDLIANAPTPPDTTATECKETSSAQAATPEFIELEDLGNRFEELDESLFIHCSAEDVYNRTAHRLLCALAGVVENPEPVHLTTNEFGQVLAERIQRF